MREEGVTWKSWTKQWGDVALRRTEVDNTIKYGKVVVGWIYALEVKPEFGWS